jgi:hypothetical protein
VKVGGNVRNDDDEEEEVERVQRPAEKAGDERFVQGDSVGDGAGDADGPGEGLADGISLA